MRIYSYQQQQCRGSAPPSAKSAALTLAEFSDIFACLDERIWHAGLPTNASKYWLIVSFRQHIATPCHLTALMRYIDLICC
jgi:hypothetical protein